MIEAHTHLAFAPRGAGLLYAVMWFADQRDVYGWYIGTRDGVPEAGYFMLPAYYAGRTGVLYRSAEDDLYGPWVEAAGRRETPLPHAPPVPQALCHELARLQDEFVRHWLFFDDDPDSTEQARRLNARELPVRHVNIKASHIRRLRAGPAVWRHDAPGADRNVLVHLSQLWPLDERLHD